jgi:hypothetical protein
MSETMLNNRGTENQKPVDIEGRKRKIESQEEAIEAKSDKAPVTKSFTRFELSVKTILKYILTKVIFMTSHDFNNI